ncbi:MAG: transketolase [Bacilli bacterium]|nr:transketolase [Bacilli bacterium]
MDTNIIANIKSLGIDMIEESGSGHPGIVLGAAPIIYTVYSKHLHYNFTDKNWLNRDRFVLSAGHGSALLYATLYMAGFDYKVEDLKQFRKFGSITPGHPEYNVAKGVEATTGPLGQGLAMGVGMALGEKILEDMFRMPKTSSIDPNQSIFDYYTYVLCGDGDLMEGVSYEASSLAGTLGLSKLIILYDANETTLDGTASKSFTENVLARFSAMGFYTAEVKNGDRVEAIDKAVLKAKRSGRPSFIKIHTKIGKDSLLEGDHAVHGKPLTEEDREQTKKKLGINNTPFYVNEQVRENFHSVLVAKGAKKYEEFAKKIEQYRKEVASDKNLEMLLKDQPLDISAIPYELGTIEKEATRISSSKILNTLARYIPHLIGGSADLSSSTMTYLKDYKDIQKNDYEGKNIWFGVREHAMGAILNGLSLSHLKVFGSTFLAFADYMKPAIRLSALMKRPVNYIFTHDSIYVGEDGPTHEPIEQLAMLRATPNLHVFRPADAKETLGCYQCMLKSSTTPNALILSRQDLPVLKTSKSKEVAQGAYIVREEQKQLHAIFIATGSEVSTAIHLADKFAREIGLDIRVVSMPCKELYEKQSLAFKQTLLPKNVHTFVMEAGSSFGWGTLATSAAHLLTVDQFGASGNKNDVLEKCQFSFEQLKQKVENVLQLKRGDKHES